jgi:regulator of cell morphogenesis and NO signaling
MTGSPTPKSSATIDRTVNEAIAANPAAVEVFARFGIDACCGGALTIAEAARRHGIDAGVLLDALHACD